MWRLPAFCIVVAGCTAAGLPVTGSDGSTGAPADLGLASDAAAVGGPDGGADGGAGGGGHRFGGDTFVTLPSNVSYGNAVAVGDVTGDGRGDIVVEAALKAPGLGGIAVVPQTAGGGLGTPTLYPLDQFSPVAGATVAIADLDGDGRLDVAAAGTTGVSILLQDAAGALRPPQTISFSVNCRANHVFAVDVDLDGAIDLVAGGTSCSGVDLWKQTGSGTFSSPSHFDCAAAGADDLAVGDLNGDGRPDVAMMVGAEVCILFGSAGGYTAYKTVALDGEARGVAVGDVNHDGREDLIVTGGGNRPSSYLHWHAQNGQGQLSAPVTLASLDLPTQVIVVDVDGDGWRDALTLHSAFFAMGVYIQVATGGFAAEETFSASVASRFAAGDVSGDGRPDIVSIGGSNLVSVSYHQ